MKLKSVFIGLFAVLSFATSAQKSGITGTVTDGQSPLAFALIECSGMRSVLTDEKGQFIISPLDPGVYQLQISHVGFEKQALTVRISVEQPLFSTSIALKAIPEFLAEAVVSGSRSERSDNIVCVRTLNKAAISSTQSQNTRDALNYISGVRTETNCQTCNYSQVRLNGLSGSYTQILINSRPVFSGLAGLYGLEQLPSQMIERIEVVRGGGSALFGSNAIAGTVNFITRKPDSSSVYLEQEVSLVRGRALRSVTNAGADLATGKGDLYSISLGKRSSQAYDANGDGFSELPQMDAWNAMLNGHIQAGDRHSVQFALMGLSEVRDGGNLLDLEPRQRTQSEHRDTRTLMGNAEWNYSLNERHNLSFYSGFNLTKRDHYTGVFQQDGYGTTDEHGMQLGVQHTYRGRIRSSALNLVWGFEHWNTSIYDAIPAYDYLIDQQISQSDLFAQGDLRVGPSTVLLAGMRGSRHSLVNNPIWAPRLGVRQNLGSHILRFSYGMGYRAPQAFDTDLHIAFSGGGINRIILSDELIQERSHSFNADLIYDVYREEKAFGYTINFFLTQLQDPFIYEEIVVEGVDQTLLLKSNGQAATVFGISLDLRAQLGDVAGFYAGYTVQQSRYATTVSWSDDVKGSKEFLRTPDHYGFIRMSLWRENPISLDLSTVLTGPMLVPHFGGSPENPNDKLQESPFFADCGAQISWKIGHKGTSNPYILELGVTNFFDQFQKDFDSGPFRDSNYVYGPASPRTYRIGFKANW